ncbi:hypothetical protein APHAL10511_006610 [Amanita phalloides]|nr:hypothetical protein APHAL10511_006610 [Amanita phalloides]
MLIRAKPPASPRGVRMPNRRPTEIMPDTGRADAGFSSGGGSSSSSTTAIIPTHAHTYTGTGKAGGMRMPPRPLPAPPPLPTPPSPSPFAKRTHNAHTSSTPFPLSLIGGDGNRAKIGNAVRTKKRRYYVVNLTEPTPISSPPFDVGLHVPDIPDLTDLQYAIQLQIEEIRGYEDELVMDAGNPSRVTTYNLRPGGQRMLNAVAGPDSRPPMSTTARAATDLDLIWECMGCFDSFKSFEGLRSSCGHYFCLPCVRTMVMASVSDESLFPPKCCNQPLMAMIADDVAGGGTLVGGNKGKGKNKDDDTGFKQIELLGFILDDLALKHKMETRWREWSVKGEERVYCSNPSCMEFLGSATEFDAGDPGAGRVRRRTSACPMARNPDPRPRVRTESTYKPDVY